MTFLRPDIAAWLGKWREVLGLAAAIAFGLWIALRPGLLLPIAGWALVIGAALFLPATVRRARFVMGGTGAGVVKVSEGRVSYLGPLDGGTVSLRDLDALIFVRLPGGPVWRLTEGDVTVDVPVDALGAERLFDAFTLLDGLNSARLLGVLSAPPQGPVVLWRRATPPALTGR
ncbi:MAG: hypothetical protein AAF914_05315 [Pseudomonadota bacterium]